MSEDTTKSQETDAAGESMDKLLTTRRATIAGLAGLGLIGASESTAASSGDHLGEGWQGSPGSGIPGLKIVKDDSGFGFEATAGNQTNNSADVGVVGYSDSYQGKGLIGHARAKSGNTRGLQGRVDSPDGTGLMAQVRTSKSGDSKAVRAYSEAAGGEGVVAEMVGSGTTYAIKGTVQSSSGYGLYTPDNAKVDGTTELATLSGTLTGGQDVTNLDGNNLNIDSSGNLNASSGSNWNDSDTDGLLEPDSSYDGFQVSKGTVDNDLQVGGDLQVTGVKNFVQAVSTDAGTKQVKYTSIESGRPRTETSDVADLEDGMAIVDLPDHFGMVTSSDEPLTVQVTPYADEKVHPQVTHQSTNQIVVKDFGDGNNDYMFAYTVSGIRTGFEDREALNDK